ncbi:hypothetical protein B0T16DRAFT_463347 [Cercophora newfieldiana]|uniref:Uncharacterized protein n=1 Tax=Cercophora newfieldiana TaxID=92897 RepID=A0AA39XU43_9PEZI|nr:hypothetical protein B0T16DRAFT_463347 [Cercophora newfieldiana]
MSSSDKPLRQRAAEKLHGKGANPSQLGDPISLKAETSDTKDPYPDTLPKTTRTPPPSSGGSHEEKKLRNGHHVRGMMTDEIRQGKVPPPKKSLEGDATSLKAETVDRDPVDHDNGAGKSKL